MKSVILTFILLISINHSFAITHPPYKVKYGYVEYTFIDRNSQNKPQKKYEYYFEEKGSTGFINVLSKDSIIYVFLVKDSVCYQIINNKVVSNDTFKSIINLIFKDNGIQLNHNFNNTLRCHACRHSLWKWRFLKFCKSWSTSPSLYGNWFGSYKGVVFALEEISTNNQQLRLIYNWKNLKFQKVNKKSEELKLYLTKV